MDFRNFEEPIRVMIILCEACKNKMDTGSWCDDYSYWKRSFRWDIVEEPNKF